MGSPQASSVIWGRTVDRAAQRLRWRRALMFFVAPVATVTNVLALTLGGAPAAGLLIVAGLLGLLLAAWIGVVNLNERSGAIIRFDGTHLLWRQVRVDVDAVESYTTFSSAMSGPLQPGGLRLSGGRYRISVGNASFRLADGTTAGFVWPNMPPEQIEAVRNALDRLLPGRWHPPTGP